MHKTKHKERNLSHLDAFHLASGKIRKGKKTGKINKKRKPIKASPILVHFQQN